MSYIVSSDTSLSRIDRIGDWGGDWAGLYGKLGNWDIDWDVKMRIGMGLDCIQ